MKKKITHNEKVNYLRVGLSLAKIGVTNATADLIIRVYEGIMKKGGEFSIGDAVKIELKVKKKYKNLQRKQEKQSKSK